MNSENRREVAERLREAIVDDGHADMPGEKRGFQVTLRRIIGTSNPTRPALYARLADLMDPTSTVEMKRVVSDKHCGHMRWVPMCSACGRLFDGEVPRFCPNCGSRLVSDSRESGSCACWSASLIDEDRRLYDIQIDLADEDAMAAIGSILGRKTGGDAHGHRSAD